MLYYNNANALLKQLHYDNIVFMIEELHYANGVTSCYQKVLIAKLCNNERFPLQQQNYYTIMEFSYDDGTNVQSYVYSWHLCQQLLIH